MTIEAFLEERRTAHYPPGWDLWDWKPDGFLWVSRKAHQSVVVSAAMEADGRPWAHASMAGRNVLPSWDDLKYLRRHWLNNRKAVQVFPEGDKYVNLHPRCLHLFSCLDGDPLPEFSGLVDGVGRSI